LENSRIRNRGGILRVESFDVAGRQYRMIGLKFYR
jgi:hypothetical protein